MNRIAVLVALGLVLAGSRAHAQSLTLSPAVVPLAGKAGQSAQRSLTLFNGTKMRLSFALEAKDVVVTDGKRAFVNAGELPGSVAQTAVFSSKTVTIEPGGERSVDVTVTLPANIQQRAVVVMFRGTTLLPNHSTASLGTLLTFDLSGQVSVAPGELAATPPTASTNAQIAVPVTNDGAEPAIVRAAAAILDPKGALRGKLALQPRRLLPGERADLASEFPGDLAPGTYRVIATIEYGKRAVTRTTALVVP